MKTVCPHCGKDCLFFSFNVENGKVVNKPWWCMYCGKDYKEEKK